jgi:hypothetical protein
VGALLVYFSGEASDEGERIRFALSRGNDPLHWQELNGGAPVLTSTVGTTGVRDPFILRSPDNRRFYLIATDLKMHGNDDWDHVQRHGSPSIVVWESTDLVTWDEQRLVRVARAVRVQRSEQRRVGRLGRLHPAAIAATRHGAARDRGRAPAAARCVWLAVRLHTAGSPGAGWLDCSAARPRGPPEVGPAPQRSMTFSGCIRRSTF